MEINDNPYVNYIPIIGAEGQTDESQGMAIGATPNSNTVAVRNEQVNEIRANRGVIGGWTITNNLLKSNEIEISSQGYLQVGTGDNIIRLDSQNVSYLLWAGNAVAASAPFSVSIAGAIKGTSGTIGGWTLASGSLSSATIVIDNDNDRIVSSNYVAGVSGFLISSTLVEAENIVARGIMKGSVFQYDIVNAVGGQLMVANADTLASDMTALDASTLTTKGTTTWAVNDIIVMRATTAGGIQEEWLRITNIASAPTYTVTRDLAGSYAADSNPIWKAGTPVVKQGSSDGASTYSGGWLRLIGEGTNSPHYSVFVRTGVAYNAYTEVARMGNLNGFLDYSSALYGFAAGNSDDYFSYDPTNGVRINTPVNVDRDFTAGEDITAGEAIGLWGYITEETDAVGCDEATYVDEDNPDTNNNNSVLNLADGVGIDSYALVSFANMPAIPSGTGITVLSIKVKIYLFEEDNGSDRCTPAVYPLNAGFDETTVTWNTKPANATTIGSLPQYSNANAYVNTGWVTINSTQYNAIKDYGVAFYDVGGDPYATAEYSDNNGNTTANPPKIDVQFIYEVQDGDAYLASGLATKYADGFLGIAQNTVSAAGTVRVRMEGVDSHQTGLTPYSDYLLSDTPGAINTTGGTSDKTIGRALSATELQIKYVLGDAT